MKYFIFLPRIRKPPTENRILGCPGGQILLILAFGLLLFLPSVPAAHACTLFAAAGGSVRGGGVLIAKNRDREPQASALRVLTPKDGYRLLALVGAGGPQAPAVAGINEKGLVVVDALPSCLPAEAQEVCGAAPLTQTLLTRCASVDEVLAQKNLLAASYPVFEMVADARQVAWIEIAPAGLVAVKVCEQGVLCHTNHYLAPELSWANRLRCRSSRVRYRRISELLAPHPGPFTLADFLSFSQDRHAGLDKSINRLGRTAAATRTLATFVVQLADAAPHLFVRISNPGEPDKIVNLTLEPALWTKGLRQKIL
jgi:isopenicillin-N N-acyltransferase like protein